MNYLQFDFEIEDAAQGEMLIAILADAGFESFEEDDHCLKAYIPEPDLDEAALVEIVKTMVVNYSRRLVPPENWNARWESGFEPVRVHDFAAIRAGFHEPVDGVQYEIIITPKMSFGTGHHATTFLMVEQMSAMDLAGKELLDFGTGTGVLAILAEKMGARAVTALDNDEWSITNSIENCLANACTKVSIKRADQIVDDKIYDIILANINLNVILASLPAIANAAKSGATILLSGFFKSDELQLFTALAQNRFIWAKTTQKGDWICLRLYKS